MAYFVAKDYVIALKPPDCHLLLQMANMEVEQIFQVLPQLCPKTLAKRILWFAFPAIIHLITV